MKDFDKTPFLWYSGCAKQPNMKGAFYNLIRGNAPPVSGHHVPVGCLAAYDKFTGGVAMPRKCIDCGNEVTPKAKRCWDCYNVSRAISKRYCIDCDAELSRVKTAKRCHSCENKRRWDAGEMHRPRGKKKWFCTDCGIKVARRAKRCSPCAGRARWKKDGYRKKQVKWRGSEAFREKYRQLMQDRWADPDYVAKWEERWADPEWIKCHSHPGETNPNWRDGLSSTPHPPEFSKALKKKIRERDDWVCQVCGDKQKKGARAFAVHHIDYDKENNRPDNLVTVCNPCHPQTNFDRNEWMKFFESI